VDSVKLFNFTFAPICAGHDETCSLEHLLQVMFPAKPFQPCRDLREKWLQTMLKIPHRHGIGNVRKRRSPRRQIPDKTNAVGLQTQSRESMSGTKYVATRPAQAHAFQQKPVLLT